MHEIWVEEKPYSHATIGQVACLVENIDAVQVLSSLAQTSSHGFLTSTESHARIVVLLVWDFRTLGVSNLALEVVVVGGLVLADSVPVSPLSVGINIHLDHTGLDGILNVLRGRSRSSVEDELHWLVILASKLLLDVLLGVVKDDWLKVNITWGVHTVHVSERGGASEGGVRDLAQLFVGIPDLLGLSVETAGVNVRVINTIFLASGNTKLEFKQDVALGHSLHVLLADGNVLLKRLLGQVKHVGREEWLTVFGEVLLVGIHKTVHPWQPGLLAMVGVENDRDPVKSSDLSNVKSSGNGSSDRGLVVAVVSGLSGDELSSSLGESHHDGSAVLLGSFHAGIDGVGSNNVDSGDGETGLLSVVKEIDEGLSSDDAGLDRSWELGEDDL